MMMTIVIRPQSASIVILTAMPQRHRLALRMAVAIGDEDAQRDDRATPSSRPGTTPAMNRLVIEISAAGRERIDHRVVAGRHQDRLHRRG